METRYIETKKVALAVMLTAWRLRPYFLSFKVVVHTNYPLRQVAGRADLSRTMEKWVMELSEYDMEFEPQCAIKAQTLDNFIRETKRVEKVET